MAIAAPVAAAAFGLTVVSAAPAGGPPDSWACAYVAERLPQSLRMLGEDAVAAEETRAARKRLMLSDAVLTRASSLVLARVLGATRVVTVRCSEKAPHITLEAQAFETTRPISGEPLRVTQPAKDLPAAIDVIARRLVSGASGTAPLKAPTARALERAGASLRASQPSERAAGLTLAVQEDAGALGLRLSAVEAWTAARDYEKAVRLATGTTLPPNPLGRAIRFALSTALLEAGRYQEARDVLEALLKEGETAAAANNLGVALFRLRDPAAPSAFARAASLKDHRRPDIEFNRSLALTFGSRAAEALPVLDDALRANPSDVRALLLRTWALRMLGREAERVEQWDRLLQMAPSFAGLATPDLARKFERLLTFERSATP